MLLVLIVAHVRLLTRAARSFLRLILPAESVTEVLSVAPSCLPKHIPTPCPSLDINTVSQSLRRRGDSREQELAISGLTCPAEQVGYFFVPPATIRDRRDLLKSERRNNPPHSHQSTLKTDKSMTSRPHAQWNHEWTQSEKLGEDWLCVRWSGNAWTLRNFQKNAFLFGDVSVQPSKPRVELRKRCSPWYMSRPSRWARISLAAWTLRKLQSNASLGIAIQRSRLHSRLDRVMRKDICPLRDVQTLTEHIIYTVAVGWPYAVDGMIMRCPIKTLLSREYANPSQLNHITLSVITQFPNHQRPLGVR